MGCQLKSEQTVSLNLGRQVCVWVDKEAEFKCSNLLLGTHKKTDRERFMDKDQVNSAGVPWDLLRVYIHYTKYYGKVRHKRNSLRQWDMRLQCNKTRGQNVIRSEAWRVIAMRPPDIS